MYYFGTAKQKWEKILQNWGLQELMWVTCQHQVFLACGATQISVNYTRIICKY
jgi:hypothetical protein